MRLKTLAILATLFAAVIAGIVIGPNYLPVVAVIPFESARAVLEAEPSLMEPRVDEILTKWGFEPVLQPIRLRSQPEFYSCSGPSPTDDAKLFAVYRKADPNHPVFAEVRSSEVESGHSFVGIDFYIRVGEERYTSRHHYHKLRDQLERHRLFAEQWFNSLGAAPREVALALQYSANRPRGESYVIVRGDHLKSIERPLPVWLAQETTLPMVIAE